MFPFSFVFLYLPRLKTPLRSRSRLQEGLGNNAAMWVWSSWKLFWESRNLHGTPPNRLHPGSGFDNVHLGTIHRSDWSGHTCGTTSLLFGNEHSYLTTEEKKWSWTYEVIPEHRASEQEQTQVAVLVPIQRGEGLVVVPWEGVPCIALVLSQTQAVPVALWFQVEAVVFCKHVPALPVLQGHSQLIFSLFSEPVEVFQTEPVLSV